MILSAFSGRNKNFTYKAGPCCNHLACIENDDVVAGKSYIWHEINSLPFTEVLGFEACHTTSKHLVKGSAERQ